MEKVFWCCTVEIQGLRENDQAARKWTAFKEQNMSKMRSRTLRMAVESGGVMKVKTASKYTIKPKGKEKIAKSLKRDGIATAATGGKPEIASAGENLGIHGEAKDSTALAM